MYLSYIWMNHREHTGVRQGGDNCTHVVPRFLEGVIQLVIIHRFDAGITRSITGYKKCTQNSETDRSRDRGVTIHLLHDMILQQYVIHIIQIDKVSTEMII